jgi:hypothetical protein
VPTVVAEVPAVAQTSAKKMTTLGDLWGGSQNLSLAEKQAEAATVMHVPMVSTHSLLSAVCCLPSAVCCLLSAVCRLLSAVYCLVPGVCWLVSVVCRGAERRGGNGGACSHGKHTVFECNGQGVRERWLWCLRAMFVVWNSNYSGVSDKHPCSCMAGTQEEGYAHLRPLPSCLFRPILLL